MTASLKKRRGIVYTPQPIVDLILDSALPRRADALAHAVICDPACGDGAFLTAAARLILSRLSRADALATLRNLCGYDIDANAIAKCKARLDATLREWYPDERVDWDVSARNAFDRHAFKDARGRFTHIVGNPPYVRVQHLEQEGRDRIAGNWSVLRGATDLYLVFYELALDLLRDGGVVGYITPSSWLRSESGSPLRERLAQSHKVKKIIDFGDNQMFEGVTTYTAITIVQKGGYTRSIPVELHDGQSLISGGAVMLDPDDPARPWWTARTDADKARMAVLMKRGARLGDIADIHVGIQTLADSVFIMPRETAASMRLEEWILRDIVKASVMKNGCDPVRRAVIFPYDANGKLLPESHIAANAPNAYEWLSANKARLLMRDKGKFDPKRWHGFGRHVSIVSGFGEKILTSGMNKRPNFQQCPDPAATFYAGYCVKPKYPMDMDWLTDALNSDDMDFFIRNTSRPYQGGWRSYAKAFISEFPLPPDAASRNAD